MLLPYRGGIYGGALAAIKVLCVTMREMAWFRQLTSGLPVIHSQNGLLTPA